MRPRSVHVRLPMAVAAALALACLAISPASAAGTTLAMDCQATPPIGSAQKFDLSAGVDATAPDTVAAGGALSVRLATEPMTVPGSVGGYTVKSIKNITLKAPVPSNATVTGARLTGGSGIGSGTPAVSVSGGEIVMSVPGPISGGQTFTLPVLDLDLTAGVSGTAIETRLSGSSYSSPGLTFTASVPILFVTVSVPTSCYPSPNPVLTSTAVD
ncbi:cyclodehydratase [Streptomyces pacificus]|uniref:Cyclodehydratase n=1 Tax=Streptomyces pacificus TaxID=2705029 RepID=A0A6A0AZ57_9ACTN|nr:cyclodehydratase [Streptomyces pacificus]GFH38172.1 cyclodehydratase [Streptomyces pacificus]